ncbi:hypothetical protein ZWY2020_031817 [Hordeum vulgare]|nr:hypothetical protein ZWY2020_031817 [Hordeum vulgare]
METAGDGLCDVLLLFLGVLGVSGIWALFDNLDGMPRYYAKIKGFDASNFKVHLTWLERIAMNEAEEKWLRDAARVEIGDTGLLDFVIKSVGDTVVGNHVVRRLHNTAMRVLEFSLEELEGPVQMDVEPSLDCKHWVKCWGLGDESNDQLRFLVEWRPQPWEAAELTRPLPSGEIIVVPVHTSIGELIIQAEHALRDTYCFFEEFQAETLDDIIGEKWDPVVLGGAETGDTIGVHGHGRT